MAQEITPAWRKQYKKEQKYEDHFKYAEGGNKEQNFTKYGKSGDSLKGGVSNPKNWPGGKWEMTHDPRSGRKKLEAKDAQNKKVSTQSDKPAARKQAGTKKATKKVITTKQ